MVSGTDVSYIYIFMQSPTRNPYDIVTEGIFSTIPLIFSLAKLLQIVESSKLSQISSWFNIFTAKNLVIPIFLPIFASKYNRRNCTFWFWRVRTSHTLRIVKLQSNGDASWCVYNKLIIYIHTWGFQRCSFRQSGQCEGLNAWNEQSAPRFYVFNKQSN